MPNQDNLTRLHENLTKRWDGFSVPLDKFKVDMQNEDNINKLYQNLSTKWEGFSVPIEQFKTDMGFTPKKKVSGEDVVPTAEVSSEVSKVKPEDFLASIKKREGLSLKAYKDGVDEQGNQKYSIGHGMQMIAGKAVQATDTITAEAAETEFNKQFNTYAAPLGNLTKPLGQKAKEAIFDFTYNTGVSRGNKLVAMINSGASNEDIKKYISQFTKTRTKEGLEEVEGLKGRRKANVDAILGSLDSIAKAPKVEPIKEVPAKGAPKTEVEQARESAFSLIDNMDFKIREKTEEKNKDVLKIYAPQVAEQIRLLEAQGDSVQARQVMNEFENSPMGYAYKAAANKPYTSDAIRAIKNLNSDTGFISDLYTELQEKGTMGRGMAGVTQGFFGYITEFATLLDDLKQNTTLKDLNKKLSSDGFETLNEEEKMLFNSLRANIEMHQAIDKRIPEEYRVGESIGASLGFMGEFIATGGVGKAAATAIRGGVKAVGKKFVTRQAKNALAKIVQSGMQTAAMPTFYKSTAIGISKGQGVLDAIGNSYYDTFKENISERLFTAKFAGVGQKNAVRRFLTQTGSAVADAKGVLGLVKGGFEEALEEKFSDVMGAAKDAKTWSEFTSQSLGTLEHNRQMVWSVGIMSGVLGFPSVAMHTNNKIRMNNAASRLPKGLKANIDAVLSEKGLTPSEADDLIRKSIDDLYYNAEVSNLEAAKAYRYGLEYAVRKYSENMIEEREEAKEDPEVPTEDIAAEVIKEVEAEVEQKEAEKEKREEAFKEKDTYLKEQGLDTEQLTKKEVEEGYSTVSKAQETAEQEQKTALEDLDTRFKDPEISMTKSEYRREKNAINLKFEQDAEKIREEAEKAMRKEEDVEGEVQQVRVRDDAKARVETEEGKEVKSYASPVWDEQMKLVDNKKVTSDEAKKRVVTYIQENYSKPIRAVMGDKQFKASLNAIMKAKTKISVAREIKKIDSYIADSEIKILKGKIGKSLNEKLLKKDPSKKRIVGKLSRPEYIRLKAVKEVEDFSSTSIDERIDEEINSTQGLLSEDQKDRLIGLTVARYLSMALEAKGTRAELGIDAYIANQEKKIQAYNEVDKFLSGQLEKGRRNMIDMQLKEKAKRVENYNYLQKSILGKDKAISRQKLRAMNQDKASAELGFTPKTKNIAKKVYRGIRATMAAPFKRIEAWEGLVERAAGKNAESLQAMRQALIKPIRQARRKYEELTVEAHGMLKRAHKKVIDEYGQKFHEETKANGIILEKTIEKKTKKDTDLEEMSLDQICDLYVMSLNPDFANRMMKNNKYTEASVNKLINHINEIVSDNPLLLDYAEDVSKFYSWAYGKINPTYQQMYYTDMPYSEGYSPDVIIGLKQDVLNSDDYNSNSSVLGRNAIAKRIHNSEIGLKEGTTKKVSDYKDQMLFFASFGKTIQDINSILSNPKVAGAIKQQKGTTLYSLLTKHLNDIANDGANIERMLSDKFIDRLWTNAVGASLGVNPKLIITQLTSFPAYAANVNTYKYIKEIAMLTTNPSQAAKDFKYLLDSPFIKTRLTRGFSRDVHQFVKQYSLGQTFKEKAKEVSMSAVKAGDVGAILLGGLPMFKVKLREYSKTMPEAQAREKALNDFIEATETAQQSSYVENLSAIQRERGAMRMFTSYMSSPIMYQQKLMSASRNIANGRGSVNDVKKLLMFAITQPIMYQVAQTGFSVLGGDDDDNERLLETVGKGVLLGTMQGIPIASKVSEYLLDMVLHKDNWNPLKKRFEPIPNLRIITEPVMLTGLAFKEFNKKGLSDKFYQHMFTLTSAMAGTIGIPLRNMKKITYDNFLRATGDLTIDDWRELLGYSKTQLGLKGKKKGISGMPISR